MQDGFLMVWEGRWLAPVGRRALVSSPGAAKMPMGGPSAYFTRTVGNAPLRGGAFLFLDHSPQAGQCWQGHALGFPSLVSRTLTSETHSPHPRHLKAPVAPQRLALAGREGLREAEEGKLADHAGCLR